MSGSASLQRMARELLSDAHWMRGNSNVEHFSAIAKALERYAHDANRISKRLTRARLADAVSTLEELEQVEDDGTIDGPGFRLEVSRLARIRIASILRCRLRWYGVEPGCSWSRWG